MKRGDLQNDGENGGGGEGEAERVERRVVIGQRR